MTPRLKIACAGLIGVAIGFAAALLLVNRWWITDVGGRSVARLDRLTGTVEYCSEARGRYSCKPEDDGGPRFSGYGTPVTPGSGKALTLEDANKLYKAEGAQGDEE